MKSYGPFAKGEASGYRKEHMSICTEMYILRERPHLDIPATYMQPRKHPLRPIAHARVDDPQVKLEQPRGVDARVAHAPAEVVVAEAAEDGVVDLDSAWERRKLNV